MTRYLTPDWARTSRSKRARAEGPVVSWRMRLPPMPSLRTPRLAVFLSAWRRRARTSGQRALASRVLWAPSVMLSPKVTMEAAFSSAATSMPLRKSQVKKVCGAVERGGGDDVARDEVVGLVGEGMEGELVDGLVGEEEADGEVGAGCDFEGYGIADDEGTWRDGDGGFSVEGEWQSASWGDGGGFGAEGDLGGADGEGVEAELVCEDGADRGATEGDVDDLAEGGAIGTLCAELCGGILGGHRGCGPGADPVIGGGGKGGGECAEEEQKGESYEFCCH